MHIPLYHLKDIEREQEPCPNFDLFKDAVKFAEPMAFWEVWREMGDECYRVASGNHDQWQADLSPLPRQKEAPRQGHRNIGLDAGL